MLADRINTDGASENRMGCSKKEAHEVAQCWRCWHKHNCNIFTNCIVPGWNLRNVTSGWLRKLSLPEGSPGVASRQRERRAGCERWAGPGGRGGAHSGVASLRTQQWAAHRSSAPLYLPRPHGPALVTVTLRLTPSWKPVENHFCHIHVLFN